ncbi:MAG: amidohydrolase family protein [Armatimonadetes bacterium]|nr:amidohydrolase family protein [Armatimonadota bacterium]
MDSSLYIRQARLHGQEGLSDIAVRNGRIASIEPARPEPPPGNLSVIDAAGRLADRGFVNIHTHLDKANLLYRMTPELFGGTLEENREFLKRLKRAYRKEEVKERARTVIEEMITNGVTAIRTQVDVDPTARLAALEALLELKQEMASRITLQLSAFPQEGVLKAGARELMEEAMRLGADVVGGLPLVESSWDDRRRHIDILFEIARRFDRDIEAQVDESNNPQEFILPYLAEKALAEGMQGRASATHCIALSAVDDAVAARTIEAVAAAEMNVIITPSCNLITRFGLPEGVASRPNNSITRVKELLAAGARVAMGTDNIRDIFYPLGNGSMLREMHVLATTTRMTTNDEIDRLFEMASASGAAVMRLESGIEAGKPADLVVFDAATRRDALCGPGVISHVIRNGRETTRSYILTKEGDDTQCR